MKVRCRNKTGSAAALSYLYCVGRRCRSVQILSAIIGVIGLFQLGCHSARRGEPIAGPMKISNPDVAHGEKLFMQHCYSCHPGGEGGLGPSLNDKPLPAFLVKTQARCGFGVMPSFTRGELTAKDLDDLTSYMIALRRQK